MSRKVKAVRLGYIGDHGGQVQFDDGLVVPIPKLRDVRIDFRQDEKLGDTRLEITVTLDEGERTEAFAYHAGVRGSDVGQVADGGEVCVVWAGGGEIRIPLPEKTSIRIFVPPTSVFANRGS